MESDLNSPVCHGVETNGEKTETQENATRKQQCPDNCRRGCYFLRSLSTTHICQLPEEILIAIFSYLPKRTLYCNVRAVCRPWSRLAMSPALWTSIEANEQIPTKMLSAWLSGAPSLQDLKLVNRFDANEIVEYASKSSKNLKYIKIRNCWGSEKSLWIHWKPLCNLVKRCRNLVDYDFSMVHFRSCKFFRLLVKKGSGKVEKKRNYLGPIGPKQMKAFLREILSDENICATVTNENHQQVIPLAGCDSHRACDDEELDRIWEDIVYGRVNVCPSMMLS